MIWNYCSEGGGPGEQHKIYQETFIETRHTEGGIQGPTIFNPVFLDGHTSSYERRLLKNIDECKQCKWGLRMVLGKCDKRFGFIYVSESNK